jgi:hypothetical protein
MFHNNDLGEGRFTRYNYPSPNTLIHYVPLSLSDDETNCTMNYYYNDVHFYPISIAPKSSYSLGSTEQSNIFVGCDCHDALAHFTFTEFVMSAGSLTSRQSTAAQTQTPAGKLFRAAGAAG